MSTVYFCRSVQFRAVHHYRLPELTLAENRRRFGPAAEPHEHLWTLTLWLTGPMEPGTGMIVDLVQVDEILEAEVVARFHNQHLNRVDPFFESHQPSTETLALYFAERLVPRFAPVRLARLRIAETDDLFAEWYA
ncbi:6-carboxy-5,6,7,8-tetrahydropterin synthase [Sulfidibacter corallicola]|uniref:6-carboxy-5,6,7,8-tetrahydropterin synthase n=1 Tax=Sulfidibacter corallicola TaxID=2818388 RepID=A0A8A4TX65_SULCO|nr:6-carboxytetrahydropterin synthase [Sulfidibacter corallicola]QTD54063.1 6-carboxytetrahydropterin synthase [Sulfidibacter corallicola]